MIELKFGRPVLAWNYKGIEKSGIYLHKESGVHCVYVNDHSIYWFTNAKPDLTAEPMNGDGVECLRHHDNRWVTARFVGLNSIKEPVVDIGDGVAVRALKVRHPQPSKRDRVREFLNSYYYPCNAEKIADQIDKIYTEDL